MKIQDVIYAIALVVLLIFHNPRYFVIAGLTCLLISMPLFAVWVFFTAERLIWYAAGLFMCGIFGLIWQRQKHYIA